MSFLLNLVERVATEGHMDAFTLVDTFGVLSPQAASYFTRTVKERLPGTAGGDQVGPGIFDRPDFIPGDALGRP